MTDMNFARVQLPADLADVLIEDRVAVLPYAARGSANEIVRLAISDVNTTASVITVVVAADAVRKLASRLWERLRGSEDECVTLSVSVPKVAEKYELKLRPEDRDGEDKVLDFLIKVLPNENG